ncbi:MAG TPA: hypothetical protein VGL42_11910 [Opitutaceae bacterium]|jgi:hypothetical protein
MKTAVLAPHILDEDLQIVRGTLAAIKPELRRFSGRAADAVQEALEKLDQARREFAHAKVIEFSPAPGR